MPKLSKFHMILLHTILVYFLSANAFIMSIGMGKRMVELRSAAMVDRVCRYPQLKGSGGLRDDVSSFFQGFGSV